MASVASIALSGIAAASLRLDAAGHNIAVAGARDARRATVRQEAQPEGGVAATLASAPAAGRGVDEEDVVNLLLARLAVTANVRVLQADEARAGRLLDLFA